MEFHIHGSRIMNWYDLAKNTKEVNYEKLVCDVYVYMCAKSVLID